MRCNVYTNIMTEITTHYKSYLFEKPIEVSNIWWEVIVNITNRDESESVYSWYDLEEKESYSMYINKCLLWWLIHGVPKKVLIIWYGGGSFVKFLEDHFENIEIVWIDIEESMQAICKDILQVQTENLLVWDAYDALDSLENVWEKYDLVLFDIYWNDSKIPEKFTNIDFFKKVKDILTDTWIFSINMSDFEWEKKKYQTMHHWLKEVFWPTFSLFLSWQNDISNVMGIYNLEKEYTAIDFDENYKHLVESWKALRSVEIVRNTVVDEGKVYLK